MPAGKQDKTSTTLNNAEEIAERKATSARYAEKHKKAKDIADYEAYLDSGRLKSNFQKEKEYQQDLENWRRQKRLETLEDESKSFKDKMSAATAEVGDALANAFSKAGSTITKDIDNRLNEYIDKQTSIAAHLVGSNDSLDNITSSLTKLSGTGLVKQTAVYNNLSNLVKQGIVSNVEQKAFLQTLADDIDATFSASDGTLVRLINLQKEDLSANRLAIEYSLQEFLNQNYETSTYIQEAFQDVSKSLIEMQSLMSSSDAILTESTIQTYLGSMFSSGMSSNTVSSIAAAINALGSGDTSNLGSGMSNLLLMAASRAGLDYADLLTNGLNASTTEALLQSLAAYMTEMGGYSSNVVKSQLASLFGVTVSDLVAAQNFESSGVGGAVTTDIYDALLDGFGDLVPAARQISNLFDNFMNTMAMDIASDDSYYLGYKITNAIADIASEMFGSTSLSLKSIGIEASFNIGQLANAAKILSIAPALLSGLSGLTTSLGSSASTLYDSLVNANSVIKSAGAGFGTTGISTSASGYIGNSDTSSLLNSTKSSLSGSSVLSSIAGDDSAKTADDIYSILEAGMLNRWGVWADNDYNKVNTIHDVAQGFAKSWDSWSTNNVDYSVTATGVRSEMNTYLSNLDLTTTNIYDLLTEKLDSIIEGLENVSSDIGSIDFNPSLTLL